MSRTGKRKPYITYPKEFKLEALRLMETSDKPEKRGQTRLIWFIIGVSMASDPIDCGLNKNNR